MKTMFILMSHTITEKQKADAKKHFGVSKFVEIPSKWWGDIPAEAESVCEYVEPCKSFLRKHASKGDILLVQGDFGATVAMIGFANTFGLKAVYATTKRVCEERVEGERIVSTRTFSHTRFRAYELECKGEQNG